MMEYELRRLESYVNWPETSKVSPLLLARSGFYYTGTDEEVECFSCKTRISARDNLQYRHRELAPHCEHLKNNPSKNISMKLLDSAAEDRSKITEDGVSRLGDTVTDDAGVISDKTQLTNSSVTLSGIYRHAFSRAARNGVFLSEVNSEIERSRPDKGPATINGSASSTNCEDDGESRRVATFRSPGAGSIRESYATSIREPREQIPAAIGSYRVEPWEVEARIDTPMVRAILDMGYSRDLIKSSIETRLSTTGDDFPSAEGLLEALFQLEEATSQTVASTSGMASGTTANSVYNSSSSSDSSSSRSSDITISYTELHSWDASHLLAQQLSRLGFYYTGNGQEVRCSACGISHSFHPEEDILRQHLNKSPHCPCYTE